MGLTPIQILRHFNKSGGPGKITKPLDAFSEDVEEQIRSKLAEVMVKDAIIVYWRSSEEWLFVLSDRVIFPIRKCNVVIEYRDIDRTFPSPNKEAFFYAKERAFLSFKTRSGDKYIVPVEAGAPAFGLWHTLSRVQG